MLEFTFSIVGERFGISSLMCGGKLLAKARTLFIVIIEYLRSFYCLFAIKKDIEGPVDTTCEALIPLKRTAFKVPTFVSFCLSNCFDVFAEIYILAITY